MPEGMRQEQGEARAMSTLTIVADIRVRPDRVEQAKAELLKLVAPTRAEAGCLQYDLHQDTDDPAHFLFFENWETRELWRAHMESDHIAAFRAATEGAIESVALSEMTKVG